MELKSRDGGGAVTAFEVGGNFRLNQLGKFFTHSKFGIGINWKILLEKVWCASIAIEQQARWGEKVRKIKERTGESE